MKITTNPVGNYTPNIIREAQKAIKNNMPDTKVAAAINEKEKEFFVNMYPEQKKEVMDYHFYQKTGKMSGVTVGTLIDRRG